MKNVYVVVGDIGSAKELVLAAPALVERGAALSWFADPQGKAADYLAKKGIDFAYPIPNPNTDAPDCILIGTSASSVRSQIAWTRIGKEDYGTPVIWYEDLWGTGEREATRCVDPDIMLVIDEVAAEIARTVRPKTEVVTVGAPSFGGIGSLMEHRSDIRQEIRDRLGIQEDNFLVTYWSGGEKPDRVINHLKALCGFHLPGRTYKCYLSLRLHPKLSEYFRQQAIKDCVVDQGLTLITSATDLVPEELSLASDAVVAEWSGVEGYKAMLLGVPTVVTMFPRDEERLKATGYLDGIPPHVRSWAATGARSPDQLYEILYFISRNPEAAFRCLEAYGKPFMGLLEDGAAGRIADAVLKYTK